MTTTFFCRKLIFFVIILKLTRLQIAESVVSSASADVVLSDINNLLQEGNKQLKFPLNQENAILVVGNTGSGKSTFAHYVAGNLTQLRSVATDDDPYLADYLIEDLNDKISNSEMTTMSKTIFPELIVDEDGDVWFDCPGFSDTRNTSFDIVINHLILNVAKDIPNLKIVFVVNHASVTKGLDRIDFGKLIKHGAQFLKNVDRYNFSTALIVNKVSSFSPRGRIPETSILNSVAKFLINHLRQLEQEYGTECQQKIIHSLLRKNSDGHYTQIGVVWRPTEPGSLDKIDSMIAGRNALRNMIKTRLNYTRRYPSDFGYALSEKAEIHIAQLSRDVKANITRKLDDIGQELKQILADRLLKLKSFLERNQTLAEVEVEIYKLISAGNQTNSTQLLGKLFETIQDLKLNFSPAKLYGIENQERALCFLRSFNLDGTDVLFSEWLQPFTGCLHFIHYEQNWNNFLIYLFDALASYEVQKNRKEIFERLSSNETEHIFGDQHFSKAILNIQNHNVFQCVKLNDDKLRDFYSILNITLKHNNTVDCDGHRMTIKGEFIKASDIDLSKCASEVNEIRLFVINTFYADSDLNIPGNGSGRIVIFAQKLTIVKNVTFGVNVANTIPSMNATDPTVTKSNGTSLIAIFKEYSMDYELSNFNPNSADERESTFVPINNFVNYNHHVGDDRLTSGLPLAVKSSLNDYRLYLREQTGKVNRIHDLEPYFFNEIARQSAE